MLKIILYESTVNTENRYNIIHVIVVYKCGQQWYYIRYQISAFSEVIGRCIKRCSTWNRIFQMSMQKHKKNKISKVDFLNRDPYCSNIILLLYFSTARLVFYFWPLMSHESWYLNKLHCMINDLIYFLA